MKQSIIQAKPTYFTPNHQPYEYGNFIVVTTKRAEYLPPSSVLPQGRSGLIFLISELISIPELLYGTTIFMITYNYSSLEGGQGG